MATKGLQSFSKGLNTLRQGLTSKDPLAQCLVPRLSRCMATITNLPVDKNHSVDASESAERNPLLPPATVDTTIYRFPSMEPLRLSSYSAKHLHLPLRRDILHRAVIFEGDFTRQGTGSTKTRWEIHGSHRKIRPQKGTGKARLGSKQSPMLKGGSKAHGPRPRDFATGLPKKLYDIAWRTALSHRYRKGELIIVENAMEIPEKDQGYIKAIFDHNSWTKKDGRTLLITSEVNKNLFTAMKKIEDHGRALTMEEVDVKDLLESTGRVVIERKALDDMLAEHSSDLSAKSRPWGERTKES